MLIFHIDGNSAAFRPPTLRSVIEQAAALGYDTILWEPEDKVRWETCPECVSPDALSKDEFRNLLAYARSLGLDAVPLLQTVGHGEYVLRQDRYAPFREQPDKYDCYCTSNPEVRAFFKRWIAEYLELFGGVRLFHLGGDEAYSFGTCPQCAVRVRNELYSEYLSDLSSVLREHGARPCIWDDMILHHPGQLDSVSRDFVVWSWNYRDGLSSEKPLFPAADTLRAAGFDLVLCAASASYGDSPFVPRWQFHAENIAGTAIKAAAAGASLCVTSWNIRQVPWRTQVPLLGIAPAVLKQPAPDDARTVIRKAAAAFFRTDDPAVPDALTDWPEGVVTAIQWTGFKDGRPAPSGHCETIMAKLRQASGETGYAALTDQQIQTADRAEDAMDAMEARRGESVELDYFLRGAELRLRFLRMSVELLRGEAVTPDNVYLAKKFRDELKRYYFDGGETILSADHQAGLVVDPLLEYWQSRI